MMPPILLLGMHRSGTSFVAGWLEKINVSLGPEFVATGIGNTFGHYEDVDFVEFHRSLLRRNRSHYLVAEAPLQFTQRDLDTAKALMTARNSENHENPWGWKDPRTCLFLDLWRSILPTANAICIYRDCMSVCDSLLRRQQKIVAERSKVSIERRLWRAVRRQAHDRLVLRESEPVWTMPRLVRSWNRHNSELIEHVGSLPSTDQSLVMSAEFLRSHWPLVVRWMRERWHYPVLDIDPNIGFRSEHYRTDVDHQSNDSPAILQSIQIGNRLAELQGQTHKRLVAS